MAELQPKFEDAQDHLEALEEEAHQADKLVDGREWRGYAELQRKILHQIAEEMGQLPRRYRGEAPVSVVRYEMVGVHLRQAILAPPQRTLEPGKDAEVVELFRVQPPSQLDRRASTDL